MRSAAIVFSTLSMIIAAPAAAETANLGSECAESQGNAESLALARGIVDSILPPDQQDQMMHQFMTGFNGQLQAGLMQKVDAADPKMQAILDKFAASVPDRAMPVVSKHLPAIKQAMACAYTHKFSIEELRSINQFALSPAGKHYFGASMSMMTDPAVAAENGLYFQDVKILMEEMKGELLHDIAVYYDSKPRPARSKKKSGH